MMLAAVLVGGVLSRLMAPTTPTVVTPPPTQAPTLVARPVVPAQPTQPANPAPQVVPLPTPTEPPAPALRAAQPAATAQARAPGEIQPATEELGMDEAQPVARAKVHHAAKPPRPPKSAAPRPVVVKPVAGAKPATSKKPGKGSWVDPFAQ
jgi:hypothetical protein